MSRYIDVDKALEDADTIDPKYKTLIEQVKRIINAQPSADAVEVVRCKDCKIGGWKVSKIDGKTKGYQCPVHAYIQDDNGYCSNGERKDGESE